MKNKLDIRSFLLEKLEDKLKKLILIAKESILENPIKNEIIKIMNALNSNPYCLASLDKNRILSYIKKYLVDSDLISQEEIVDYFDNSYEVIRNVSEYREKGLTDFEYEDDELIIFNKLIEYLEIVLKELENEENLKLDSLSQNDELSSYSSLCDKLRSNNPLELITEEEIIIIVDLISNEELEVFYECVNFINDYNNQATHNKIEEIDHFFDEDIEEETLDDKAKTKHEKITMSLLEEIFSKYGYTLEGIPKNILTAMLYYCSYNNIIEIFNFIEEHDEFKFLKNFGKKTFKDDEGNEHKKNDRLIKREFIVLYNILRFSNKEILSYLAEHNKKEPNVELEDVILKVKGVVRKVSRAKKSKNPGGIINYDDFNESGSYENYIHNSNYLIELDKQYDSGDSYLNIALSIEAYRTVLTSDYNRVFRNIEILKLYGFEFTKRLSSKEPLPWLKCLVLDSNDLLNRIDLLIENGIRNDNGNGKRDESFNYCLMYPSVLYYKSNFAKAIALYSYTGKLDYRSDGSLKEIRRMLIDDDIKIEDQFEKNALIQYNYSEQIGRVIPEAFEIDLSYSDTYLARLDKYIVNNGSMLDGLAYDIGGVIISLPKIKRIWKALYNTYKNDSNIDLEELFIIAITYNSYLSEEEINIIIGTIKGRKL